MYVNNLREEWISTKEQSELFATFGKQGIFYSTCDGIIDENQAYSTKELLIDSLK